MNIQLLETPIKGGPREIFLGKGSRMPTVTDVHFLSDSLLVAAHRCGAYVYLIKFDIEEKSYTILNRIRTEFNGVTHFPDTLTIQDNIIYIACYSACILKIQIVNQTTLKVVGTITSPYNIPYHGITSYNGCLYATPCTDLTTKHSETFIIIDPNQRTMYGKSFPEPYRIKAIAFFSNNRILVALNTKCIISMETRGSTQDGRLALCDSSFNILNTHAFPLTQFDDVAVSGNTFYASAGTEEEGYIIKGNLFNDQLCSIEKIPVQGFPHGISIFQNKLYAYTSYSTSSIYIQDFDFTK